MQTGESGPARWYVVVGRALLQAAEHYQLCGRNEELSGESRRVWPRNAGFARAVRG